MTGIARTRLGRVRSRNAAWVIAVIAIAGALLVSFLDDGRARTTEDRIAAIAATIKCPTCAGQSAAESDAPASQAIRGEIGRRLQAGQSADQIRGYFADRYGTEILLTPPTRGLGALVWVLPLLGLTGGAVLVAMLLRLRPRLRASDEDRDLVSATLASTNSAAMGQPASSDGSTVP